MACNVCFQKHKNDWSVLLFFLVSKIERNNSFSKNFMIMGIYVLDSKKEKLTLVQCGICKDQRYIQSLVKQKKQQLLAVNYFHKKFLLRCLIGFLSGKSQEIFEKIYQMLNSIQQGQQSQCFYYINSLKSKCQQNHKFV